MACRGTRHKADEFNSFVLNHVEKTGMLFQWLFDAGVLSSNGRLKEQFFSITFNSKLLLLPALFSCLSLPIVLGRQPERRWWGSVFLGNLNTVRPITMEVSSPWSLISPTILQKLCRNATKSFSYWPNLSYQASLNKSLPLRLNPITYKTQVPCPRPSESEQIGFSVSLGEKSQCCSKELQCRQSCHDWLARCDSHFSLKATR